MVSKELDDVSPQSLLEEVGVEEWCCVVGLVEQVNRPGKDQVFVASFVDGGGGGLITYVKASKQHAKPTFVHTLNTPSGFKRKIEAMGFAQLVDHAVAEFHRRRELARGAVSNE